MPSFQPLADLDLAHAPDTGVARRLLDEYAPRSEEQDETRQRMLAFIDEHPSDAHSRSCLPGHLTASVLLVDATEERALLTFHRKLERWLQLGGHCDGDANLIAAAVREAQEESGIDRIQIDPTPIDLDIHVIPARKSEPEHLHLDTRFVARADSGTREVCSEESLDLRWFTPRELETIETDDSVRRLFELVF